MGSLPNLQALSDDPTVPYKYKLREPEELPSRYTGPAIATFNSQHYVDRCRVDQQDMERRFYQLVSENKSGHHSNTKSSSMRHHHRVRQTRSTGSSHNPCLVANSWEEYLLELQMTATSPLSSRSSRSNVMFSVNQGNHTNNNGSMRRRDSLGSGASSVRQLISVVRSTPSRLGPVYPRRVLYRNFAALCLGHVTITAALLPLLSLQSSVSSWWWGEGEGPGAELLALAFAVASLTSLVSPYLIYILGCNWALVVGYVGESIFFVAHLYPTLKWLVGAYIVLGICLGSLFCARTTYVDALATKMTYLSIEDDEYHDVLHQHVREHIINKLMRGLQASQHAGMFFGNLLSWFFLQYSWATWEEDARHRDMFEETRGELICGAQACPLAFLDSQLLDHEDSNSTWIEKPLVPCRTTTFLASVFVGCGLVAVALTAVFTGKLRLFMHQDPLERPAGVAVFLAMKNAFCDPRLQLAAPLSIFIGLQQGFIHADFTKWYVVCSLGIPYINLVLVSMALLQGVATFTLFLLVQHVPRTLVVAAGFVFHSCLLLVLILWKPVGDDSDLLYVIAAAWGTCNAIWETLNFTMLLKLEPESGWKAAFCHGHFFRCIGFSLSLGLHDSVCTGFKLYSLAASLVLAVAPHTWLEIRMDLRRRKSGLSNL